MEKEKIIMGIDPGTNVMGFGVIRVSGKRLSLVTLDALVLSTSEEHSLRLKKIFEYTLKMIELYAPDEVALEEPFYGKNVQSMIKLGRAQGVAMAAALSREIPVSEYLPKKVKMAVTGNGNASKEQVAGMLATLVGLKEIPRYLDATDAVAIAICHHFNSSDIATGKSYTGWDAFIKKNPGRIK